LLPGSRLSEIEHLLPVFLDAVSILKQRMPSLNFVLPVAPGLMNKVQSYLAKHAAGAFIRCFQGQSQTAMVASDAVLVASGTATLEAALCKRPMVVAYRMPALSWWITQKKRLQPWVSLPNILCERFVVPEFLQEDCTAANLAQSVQEQLQLSPSAQRAMRSTWDALHVSLMRNTSLTASQAVREVLAHA
jgi:lipid-A-disaccharide synthase